MSSSFNPSITRDASGEIPRIHPGARARNLRHGQMMGPNYGIGSPYVLEAGGNAAINAAMARQASQTQTPFYEYEAEYSTSPVVAARKGGKKGTMIKDIADALKDLDPGPDATELAGGKFGRGMPAQLGFSLASMGGRLGEQEAMAKARREEELRRRMKLMGGGY